MCAHTRATTCVQIRGKLLEINPLLPCGSLELNLGCQSWWQAPTETSHWPDTLFFFKIRSCTKHPDWHGCLYSKSQRSLGLHLPVVGLQACTTLPSFYPRGWGSKGRSSSLHSKPLTDWAIFTMASLSLGLSTWGQELFQNGCPQGSLVSSPK